MNSEHDLTLIDQYVNGKMPLEERVNFELRLLRDEDFKDAYNFVLSVKSAAFILESKRIKNFLKDISEEEAVDSDSEVSNAKDISINPATHNSEAKVFSIWPYIKYAGIAAVLLLALIIWQPNKTSNEELFNAYNSGNIELPAIAMDLSEPKNSDNNIRGENDSQFKNYTYEEVAILSEAITLTNNREYARAKESFYRILKPQEEDPTLLLFLGISQINTNEIELGISTLEKLKDLKDPNYQDDINFHLAMGYIKSGKLKDARNLLNTLQKGNGKYTQQASLVLNKLRWF